MSSSRSIAFRVLRLRVKDKHAAWLCGLAREVNTVFNYCNELSVKVFERERRFLSGFDFWPFLKGVTRGDCALHLPVQAMQTGVLRWTMAVALGQLWSGRFRVAFGEFQ